MARRPPSNITQTQVSELPAWAGGQAATLLGRAEALSNKPYEAYPGDRVVGLNQMQLGALGMVKDRALYGDPVEAAARGSVTDTLGGRYLEANPYMDRAIGKSQQEAVDVYQNVLKPSLDARAVRARALGSSGYESALKDMNEGLLETIGDIGVQQRSTMYDAERARQLAATQFAPTLAQMPYQNAQMLMGAGDVERMSEQDKATAAYEDWLMQQMYPYQQLDVFGGGLGSALGSGAGQTMQTGPNPYRGSPMAGALGGGLLGYGLSQMNPNWGQYSFPLTAAGSALGAYFS